MPSVTKYPQSFSQESDTVSKSYVPTTNQYAKQYHDTGNLKSGGTAQCGIPGKTSCTLGYRNTCPIAGANGTYPYIANITMGSFGFGLPASTNTTSVIKQPTVTATGTRRTTTKTTVITKITVSWNAQIYGVNVGSGAQLSGSSNAPGFGTPSVSTGGLPSNQSGSGKAVARDNSVTSSSVTWSGLNLKTTWSSPQITIKYGKNTTTNPGLLKLSKVQVVVEYKQEESHKDETLPKITPDCPACPRANKAGCDNCPPVPNPVIPDTGGGGGGDTYFPPEPPYVPPPVAALVNGSSTGSARTSGLAQCTDVINQSISCTGIGGCINNTSFSLPSGTVLLSNYVSGDTRYISFRDQSGVPGTKTVVWRVDAQVAYLSYTAVAIPAPQINVPTSLLKHPNLMPQITVSTGFCPEVTAYINTPASGTFQVINAQSIINRIMTLDCGTHTIYFFQNGVNFKTVTFTLNPVNFTFSITTGESEGYLESMDINEKGHLIIQQTNYIGVKPLSLRIITDSTFKANVPQDITNVYNGQRYNHPISLWKPKKHKFQLEFDDGCKKQIVDFEHYIKPIVIQKNEKLLIKAEDGTSFKYDSIVITEGDGVRDRVDADDAETDFTFKDLDLRAKCDITKINDQGFVEIQLTYIGKKQRIDNLDLELNLEICEEDEKLREEQCDKMVNAFREWNKTFTNLAEVFHEVNSVVSNNVTIRNLRPDDDEIGLEDVLLRFKTLEKNTPMNIVLPFVSPVPKFIYMNFLISRVPIKFTDMNKFPDSAASDLDKDKKLPIIITDIYDNLLFIDGDRDLQLENCDDENDECKCCKTTLTYKMYINDTIEIDRRRASFIIKNSPELIPLRYWEGNTAIDIPRNDKDLIEYVDNGVTVNRGMKQKEITFGDQNVDLQMFYENNIDHQKKKTDEGGYVSFQVVIPPDINNSADQFITYDELMKYITVTHNSIRNINPLIYRRYVDDPLLIKNHFEEIGGKWYIKNPTEFFKKNSGIKYKITDIGYEIIDTQYKGYVFKNIDKAKNPDYENIIMESIKLFDQARKGSLVTLRFKLKVTSSQFVNEILLDKDIVDNYFEFKVEYKMLRECESDTHSGILKTKFQTNEIYLLPNQMTKEICCNVDTDIKLFAELSNSYIELGKNNNLQVRVSNRGKRNKNVRVEIEIDPDSDVHYEALKNENTYRQGNKIFWFIGNMDSKSATVLGLQLKAILLGSSVIRVSLYDYMHEDEPIQVIDLQSLIINQRKEMFFNVTQDHTFVFPNQDNNYRATIKNLSGDKISNVYVRVINPNAIFFKDFALVKDGEVVPGSNRGDFPDSMDQVYEIGDLPRNRLIVFDLEALVAAQGHHCVTFICWGDNTPVYTKTLCVGCGYVKPTLETKHNIIFYNFTPYQSHYQLRAGDYNQETTVLEKIQHRPYGWDSDPFKIKPGNESICDNFITAMENKNKDNLPAIHVPRENFGINIVEQYSGTNMQELFGRINKYSEYVKVEPIREGTNIFQNTFQPIYPNGLIHRFGLLKSELYHHTGVIPEIQNEDYRVFRWKPDTFYINEYPIPQSFYWNTKRWSGVLYNVNRIYLNEESTIINKQFIDSFDTNSRAREFIRNQVLSDKYIIEELDDVYDIDYEISARYYDGGVFSVNIPVDRIPSNFFMLNNEELFGIIEKTKPYGLRPVIKYTKNLSVDLRPEFKLRQKWYPKISFMPFDFDRIKFWIFEKQYDYELRKFINKGQAYYDGFRDILDLRARVRINKLKDVEYIDTSIDSKISSKQLKTIYKLNTIEDYLHLLNTDLSFYKMKQAQKLSNINKRIIIEAGTHPTLPSTSFDNAPKVIVDIENGDTVSARRINNIDTNDFGFYLKDFNTVKTFTFTNKNNRYELSKNTYIGTKKTSSNTVVVKDFDEIAIELVNNYAVLYYSLNDKWFFFDSFKLTKLDEFGVFLYNNKINQNQIVFDVNTDCKFSSMINDIVQVSLPTYYDKLHQQTTNIQEIPKISGNAWRNLFRLNSDESTFTLNENVTLNPVRPNGIKLSFKPENIPINSVIKEINLKNLIKTSTGKVSAKVTGLSDCYVPTISNINLDFLNVNNAAYIINQRTGTITLDNFNISLTDGNHFVIEGYNKGQKTEIVINNRITENIDKGYFYKQIKINDNKVNFRFKDVNKTIELFDCYILSSINKEISLNEKVINNNFISLLNKEIRPREIKNGLDIILDFDSLQPNDRIQIHSIETEILYQKMESSFNDAVKNDSTLSSMKNKGNSLFTHNVFIERPYITQDKFDKTIELKDAVYQSFIPQSSLMTSVEFHTQGKVGNPEVELELSLYTSTNDMPDKKLKSKIINGWSSRDLLMKYNFFYSGLEMGTKYWIKIEAVNKSKTNYYLLRYLNNFSSIGKMLFVENGNIANKNDGRSSLAFNVYSSGVIETFNFLLNRFKIIDNPSEFLVQSQVNGKNYNDQYISNIKINEELNYKDSEIEEEEEELDDDG
jgi:hypothetical protein